MTLLKDIYDHVYLSGIRTGQRLGSRVSALSGTLANAGEVLVLLTGGAMFGASLALRSRNLALGTVRMMSAERRLELAREVLPKFAKVLSEIYRPRVSDHACDSCKDNYGLGYMLIDDVWYAATRGHTKQVLCIECVQRLLGRPLTPEDFMPEEVAPINGPIFSAMNIGRHFDRLRCDEDDEDEDVGTDVH